ncbi:hypothetical protein LTR42_006473 [Elasticomyces elasticus]|nr:hypothetical protein LTR42_006473 [Elasticomyces elasticus]
MLSQSPERTTHNRARASKACARCNKKRVKCDALTVGQPCSRCRRGGISECVLISSRRGLYKRQRAATSSLEPTVQSSDEAPVSQDLASHAEAGTSAGAAAEALVNLGSREQANTISTRREDTVAAEQQQSPLDPTPSSQKSAGSGAAYQEVSWATMFNHFLDTRQTHRADAIDKCSITYLGESFPLALVLEDLREGGRTRLHHQGPPLESPESALNNVDGIPAHPLHLLPEDVKFLEAKHVFECPSKDVLGAMVDVLLNRFLPLYSILSRQELLEQYQHDRMPWILIHACCFIATTFGPDSLVHQAGFTSRKEARYSYYSKAKALFDAGYERNKIVVLQSTIMLTFWGGGPNDYWNTWSWISTAVTIAETLGVHRSTSGTNMAPKDRSLLKRLWWTLVVRDASCSTLVGRPFRINMEHGDAEMLTLQDFEHDVHALETTEHIFRYTSAHYQIQVAKLSLLLYDIDYARFVPGPKALTMNQVYERLQAWKNYLPAQIDWEQDQGGTNLLATCLSMMYDHHLMLASLGVSSSEAAAGASDTSTTGIQHPFAELAAQRVSTQASAIVMKSQALLVPHETYQPVFLAGVVSYISMRSSQPMLAQVGRLVVDNCRMVLHSVREAWDAAPWVITLFDGLTSSVNAVPRQQTADPAVYGTGRTPVFNFGSIGDFDESMMSLQMPASWQTNPMLSALFDTSQPLDAF